ncbi:hypothetical protein BIY21_13280 [Vibrio ponticus]|uniref:Lipoprotein n=1 Tax=Vibrio ponticus TaxID=265668 RepID=A0ABX3FFJ4_9VIBR|nr:hypothetical protein [Vibrio ponticus]OLQ91321.1 hypothetical protein BIY21_13280 [Vibrio ponticus]
MYREFRLSKLSACLVAASLLAGCNSESDQASTGSESVNAVAPAKVTLGAKFPQSEVDAAWIGDSQEIQVSFYNTEYIGSVDEAEQAVDGLEACLEYNYEPEIDDNYLHYVGDQELTCSELQSVGTRGIIATTAYLNAAAPTTGVELNPGKYRVEAAFYDAESNLQETSVSYVTLGEGSHSLKLRGVEATWTATTPLNLQLLNTASQVDWDWTQDGVQTAAEALGITGAIKGIHLPTALTYPAPLAESSNKNTNQLEISDYEVRAVLGITPEQAEYATWSPSDLEAFQLSSLYQPIFRIVDGNDEFNLLPRIEDTDVIFENGGPWPYTGWNRLYTELGYLLQEYAAEGDQYGLSLGALFVGTTTFDETTQAVTNHFSHIRFGLYDVEESELGNWYNLDHYYNPGYWDGNAWAEYQDMEIAYISFYSESGDHWHNVFNDLQGQRLELQDGSTIVGSLIEVQGSYSWGYEASRGEPIAPTPYLDASLNEIAVEAGLVSRPAEDNCHTFEYGSTSFSNQYLWDEVNQRWVAGSFNELVAEGGVFSDIELERERIINGQYDSDEEKALILDRLAIVEDEITTVADFNGDGVLELFEAGAYVENSQYCSFSGGWSEQTEEYEYTVDCNVSAAPTVTPWTHSEDVTMCVQPVTLTASQLAMNLETNAEVGIE